MGVMEVKQNLVEADRKANIQRFSLSHFKKVAHVVMGEPPKDFKEKVQTVLLANKQAKEEQAWKKRKAGKERKKLERERKKVADENLKKAKEAAAKRMEENQKRIAEVKAKAQAKKDAEAAAKGKTDAENKGSDASGEKPAEAKVEQKETQINKELEELQKAVKGLTNVNEEED